MDRLYRARVGGKLRAPESAAEIQKYKQQEESRAVSCQKYFQ